jgi:hypothetical protein
MNLGNLILNIFSTRKSPEVSVNPGDLVVIQPAVTYSGYHEFGMFLGSERNREFLMYKFLTGGRIEEFCAVDGNWDHIFKVVS